MFMFGRIGTNSHVLLLIRALNSSVMARFQMRLLRDSVVVWGSGSKGAEVWRINICLGLDKLVILCVHMARVGGGDGLWTSLVDDGASCDSRGSWVSVRGWGEVLVVYFGGCRF